MLPINVNTVTVDELRQLPQIANARALVIIKCREENGPVTREAFMQIEAIPATVWEPLLREGRITFEEPHQQTGAASSLPAGSQSEVDISDTLQKFQQQQCIK